MRRSKYAIAALAAAVLGLCLIVAGGALALGGGGDDTPALRAGSQPLAQDEATEERLLQLDLAFITRRTAGDLPLDNQRAGALRAEAARAAARLRKEGVPTSGPSTFTDAWTQIGPNPIVQQTRSSGGFAAMSGRIGALAIRPSNGQFILGAAQGGIWLYDTGTGTWVPKSDSNSTQAIGALAIAPSDDAIVYAGTGEGALSGDSYFGDGVIKSTDGGNTWTNVSGDYFRGVSMSRVVVDPTNANHVYAAVLRGRGGARRTSPTVHSRYGVWESKDGGVTWNLIQEVKSTNGATDLEIDPQNPQILYSSFWGDAIYKSTDGGAHWSPIMNFGLPSPNFAAALTRFSISLSHPSAGGPGTLYAGFDWADATGYHPSRVWKSTDGGTSWTLLPKGDTGPQGTDDSVEDYCGGQCFYDNVIEADPTNPDVVFAAGQFNYAIGSGGIFRSDDGGTTWKNLGYDQHPDFHALAFNTANPARVLIGSDGGVWTSPDRGGRPNTSDPLSAVTWEDLNGTVVGLTVAHRTNLAIAQFTSIATVPQAPLAGLRFWGGTQDNGTLRKTGSLVNHHWFDVASGDGGQVLVDPTPESCVLGPACHVYGTYFGISPYRYTDGGNFFTNQYIRNGLNLGDRSDFYIPFAMNKESPNQLFLGTYRLYRTDTAKAPSAGDVKWKTISPDLTSGCAGTAPNGARNCSISAIGVGGGQAVYTGSLDGLVYVSTDAQVNDSPSWTRVDRGELPKRPIASIAVDRSNYRIAYLGYNGFNAATPGRPGHVFRTLDGGGNWADITGNLPDTPVNSIVLDPSFANTLYVGTDVGPFVTYNGGVNWSALGVGKSFPLVAIDQLDLDSSHRFMAAGAYGRGAYKLADTVSAPALVLSKVDAGVPVGPSSALDYTITLKNEGNAAADGVVLTDPVPANTTFLLASDGGSLVAGKVTWPAVAIPAGGSITRTFTVDIGDALKNKVKSIVNDGFRADATDGFYTTGSPVITPIAPPYAVSVSPAAQTDGGRVGTSVPYTVTVRNLGFNSDSYTMSAANAWATSLFDAATCTTPLTTVGPLAAGASANVCVKVAVPGDASNGATNTGTVTATSVASPSVSASATLTTIAVSVDTLLVDNDDNNPNVQSYYTTALTSAGVQFSTWDLATDKNLPVNYTKAFKNVVWFTGNSYPGPITPYEGTLKAFLDNGGRLFMSGQDILDQAAGTTTFVHDYLHISWDGSETQNDKATATVTAAAGTLTDGLGTVALNHSVLGAAFEDRITPIPPAVSIFKDDTAADDGLSVDTGAYKVVFIAFPFEAYGSASDRSTLMSDVFGYFGP